MISGVLFSAAMFAAAPAAERLEFPIPRIAAPVIDGALDDWDDRGFLIDIFPDPAMRLARADDLRPSIRIGWTAEGLAFAIDVVDDVPDEHDEDARSHLGDSVEIYVAPRPGARNFYQLVLSHGATESQPALRQRFFDRRADSSADLTVQAASSRTPSGYTIEALLPWSNLAMTPDEGTEAALQIYVNDRDGEPGLHQAAWHPQARTIDDPSRMHAIRLAGGRAVPAQRIAALGRYDGLGRAIIELRTTAAVAGESFTIREGKRVLAEGAFESAEGWGSAKAMFPIPAPGGDFDPLLIRAGDDAFTLFLPDAEYERRKAIIGLEMRPSRAVFMGANFPSLDFENPLQAEALLGGYSIRTRFFDADYNEVDRAGKPGRYGAIAEAACANGMTIRRHLTLYRAPDAYTDLRIWFVRPEPLLPLPLELGLTQDGLAAQGSAFGKFYQEALARQFRWDWHAAALAAGVAETAPGATPRSAQNDAFSMDRQWWVGLKRRLNGNDARFGSPSLAPRPEANPAPVLREGTEAEAGMRAGIVDELDALFTEWAAKSGEPFAVCFARNGVVFMHRAYGMNYAEPMTADTQRWIASISKFFSGTLMSLFVDRGLVGLDDPVAKYLPEFEGIDVPHDLTIRHLYTHTNGLNLGIELPLRYADHWGDEDHDLEARIAAFYPVQKVNIAHGYNGVGYALAGKVMEQVSGDALPILFEKYLLEPLAMSHTDAVDASARTFSTPHDLARWGQLMLNRGAYGDKRFLSEATFEAMMPKPIAHLTTGGDPNLQWGIGAVRMRRAGLSDTAFGHGAASSSDFIVDPELGLVIAMTRNQAGPHWLEYHDKYFDLLTAAVEK